MLVELLLSSQPISAAILGAESCQHQEGYHRHQLTIPFRPYHQPSPKSRDHVERIMDPAGDLCLKVGRYSRPGLFVTHVQAIVTSFTVCSRSLARASPVFNTMLFGSFKESRGREVSTPNWSVDLPDDDAEAMELLLNIIHANFSMIPDKFPSLQGTERLYQIAVLADKYDCIDLLRPWVKTWILGSMYQASGLLRLRQWAWISWVLGDLCRFEDTLRDMVRFYEDQKPSLFGGNLFMELAEPLDLWGKFIFQESPYHFRVRSLVLETCLTLTETVKSRRLQLVTELSEPYRRVASDLTLPEAKRPRLCSHAQKKGKTDPSDRSYCEAAMLGCLIQNLTSVGLWPIPDPEEVTESCFDMAKKLKSLQYSALRSGTHHCRPLADFSERVDRSMQGLHGLATNGQIKRLERHASKSGISSSARPILCPAPICSHSNNTLSS